jgi:hypothetical protein
MNITQARKLAHTSTQYGYFDQGGTLWVNCPLRKDGCSHRPATTYSMWATDGKGKRLNKIQQIRRAVFEHLRDDHGTTPTKGKS